MLLAVTSQLSSSGSQRLLSASLAFSHSSTGQSRAPNRDNFWLIRVAMATSEIQQMVFLHAAFSLLVLHAEGEY